MLPAEGKQFLKIPALDKIFKCKRLLILFIPKKQLKGRYTAALIVSTSIFKNCLPSALSGSGKRLFELVEIRFSGGN